MFGWAASNSLTTLHQDALYATSNCSQCICVRVVFPPFLLELPLLLVELPLLLQADSSEAPAPAAARPPESWKKLRRLSCLAAGTTFASLRALSSISFLC